MQRADWLPPRLSAWIDTVRAELAPFPGRADFALRLTLTCALTIVISMTFQIPYLALSIGAVFFAVQSNAAMTRLVGIILLLSIPLSLGVEILLLKYTYDAPFLRLVCASLILAGSMYLMRVLKIGFLFFGISIVILYVQSFAGMTGMADYLVHQILWSAVAFGYPTVLALLINTYFFPSEPLSALKAEVSRQLERVAACMEGNEPRGELSTLALQQDSIALQKLSQAVGLRDSKESYASKLCRNAYIASVSHLQLICRGEFRILLPTSLARQLRAEVLALGTAIGAERPYRMQWKATAEERAALSADARAADVFHTLLALDRFPVATLADRASPAKEPLLLPDALTNPAYLRFAFKALLCSLVAYVFYNAVQWEGIHTMLLTCAIVACASEGASVRKMALRVYGGILGSVAALLLFIFVLPQVDGLGGLLCAVMPVIALGAWIGAGSEKSAYVGMQAVLTMSLALLEHSGPSNDLGEIRDRVIGILLGVGLCAIVYTCVWPESEKQLLRDKLAATLRSLGLLVAPKAATGPASAPAGHVEGQLQCWVAFNDCQDMLDRVALEGESVRGETAGLVQLASTVLERCRDMLAAQVQLEAGVATLGAGKVSAEAARIVQAWQQQAADVLDQYAQSITLASAPPRAAQWKLLNDGRQLAIRRDSSVSTALPANVEKLACLIAELPEWPASDVQRSETADSKAELK